MKLDEREQGFIDAARAYARGPAPGFPGHKLILLVAKLADEVDRLEKRWSMVTRKPDSNTLLHLSDDEGIVYVYRIDGVSMTEDGIDVDVEPVAAIPYSDLHGIVYRSNEPRSYMMGDGSLRSNSGGDGSDRVE